MFIPITLVNSAKAETIKLTLDGLIRQNASSVEAIKAYMTHRYSAYQAIESGKGKRRVYPISQISVDTLQAKLVNTFISGEPIFQAVTQQADLTALVPQVNAAIEWMQRTGKWRKQLSLAFLDGIRYNLLAVEVSRASDESVLWKTEDGRVSAEETSMPYSAVERIDLFKASWDTSVSPDRLAEEGQYFVQARNISYQQVRALVEANKTQIQWTAAELNELYDTDYTVGLANYDLNSASYFDVSGLNCGAQDSTGKDNRQQDEEKQGANWYSEKDPDMSRITGHTPEQAKQILAEMQTKLPGKVDSDKVTKLLARNSRVFVKESAYLRCIPAELGLTGLQGVQNSNKLHVIKLTFINGKLLMAELLVNSRTMPVFMSMLIDGGYAYLGRSYQHMTEWYQANASDLVNMEFMAISRAIGGREIFNPNMVHAKDVRNPSPTAKMAIRSHLLGNVELSKAIYTLPFQDPMLGRRMDMAIQLAELANRVVGQNAVEQGEFIKGNKTNSQFQESIAASGSRRFTLALVLHDNFITPLKDQIKRNLLEFQTNQQILDPITKQIVQVDPDILRRAAFDLVLTDGLVSPDRLLNTGELLQLLQTAQGIPNLDIPSLLNQLAVNKNLRSFVQFQNRQGVINDQSPAQAPNPDQSGNAQP